MEKLRLFTFSHSNICEVICHCSFNLISLLTNDFELFPPAYWLFIYILWEVSVQVFCLFSSVGLFVFIIEL